MVVSVASWPGYRPRTWAGTRGELGLGANRIGHPIRAALRDARAICHSGGRRVGLERWPRPEHRPGRIDGRLPAHSPCRAGSRAGHPPESAHPPALVSGRRGRDGDRSSHRSLDWLALVRRRRTADSGEPDSAGRLGRPDSSGRAESSSTFSASPIRSPGPWSRSPRSSHDLDQLSWCQTSGPCSRPE